MKTFKRLVSSTGAQVLVAPHFCGAGVLENYKKQNSQTFAAVVPRDYVPRPIGVPPNLDLYVVADETAAEVVAKLGAPEERIHATNIPIVPAFEEPADGSSRVRQELLILDEGDLPIALVMGGGLGGGELERTVSLLFEASAAVHLVVLCGSNDLSRNRLQRVAE